MRIDSLYSDAQRWIGPHHLLNELQQLGAIVQVHLRKVFSPQPMPGFASVKNVSKTRLCTKKICVLVRYYYICCCLQHRHAKAVDYVGKDMLYHHPATYLKISAALPYFPCNTSGAR